MQVNGHTQEATEAEHLIQNGCALEHTSAAGLGSGAAWWYLTRILMGAERTVVWLAFTLRQSENQLQQTVSGDGCSNYTHSGQLLF